MLRDMEVNFSTDLGTLGQKQKWGFLTELEDAVTGLSVGGSRDANGHPCCFFRDWSGEDCKKEGCSPNCKIRGPY